MSSNEPVVFNKKLNYFHRKGKPMADHEVAEFFRPLQRRKVFKQSESCVKLPAISERGKKDLFEKMAPLEKVP